MFSRMTDYFWLDGLDEWRDRESLVAVGVAAAGQLPWGVLVGLYRAWGLEEAEAMWLADARDQHARVAGLWVNGAI